MGDPTTAPRELAQRWLADVGGPIIGRALTPDERERLFSWVRADIDAYDAVPRDRPEWLDSAKRATIAALGLDENAGLELCRIAGRPS